MRFRVRSVVLAAAVASVVAGPAEAQFYDSSRPYQYVTGSFEAKKDAGISFLISNPSTQNASVTLRLYTATTQVGSTFTVNVQSRNTLTAILFATATGLHFAELNSNVPNITVQYRHTDAASVTRFVDAGNVLRIDSTLSTAANVSDAQEQLNSTMTDAFGSLGNKVDALATPISTLQSTVGSQFETVNGKLDSLASTSNARPVEQPAATPDPALATLRKDVAGLRRQLKSLRKLLKQRLPARKKKSG